MAYGYQASLVNSQAEKELHIPEMALADRPVPVTVSVRTNLDLEWLHMNRKLRQIEYRLIK
jgi:hypothetical protein